MTRMQQSRRRRRRRNHPMFGARECIAACLFCILLLPTCVYAFSPPTWHRTCTRSKHDISETFDCGTSFWVSSQLSRNALKNKQNNIGPDRLSIRLHADMAASLEDDDSDKQQQQQSASTTSSSSSSSSTAPFVGLPSYKRIIFFVATTFLIWVSEPLLSLVDSAAVGRYAGKSLSSSTSTPMGNPNVSSVIQLAALGPATMLCDSSIYLTLFIAMATTNKLARAFAKRDLEDQIQTMSHVLGVSLAVGILLLLFITFQGERMLAAILGPAGATLSIAGAKGVMKSVDLTPEVLRASLGYAKIRSAVSPLAVMGLTCQSALLCAQDTRTPALAVLMASVVNCVGDYVFVAKMRWGVRGAALATSMASLLANGMLVLKSRMKIGSGQFSPGGEVQIDADTSNGERSDDDSVEVIEEEERNANYVHPESCDGTTIQSMDPTKGFSPTGGWRSLTEPELITVEKLGERDEQTGELSFQTYDLSHIVLDTDKAHVVASYQNILRARAGESPAPLRTVFSVDSNTSEDERLNPKSPEDMANDTARLFRRSEISLKETAEKERIAQLAREAEERRLEVERFVRERDSGLMDDDNPLNKSMRSRRKRGGTKIKGGGKYLAKQISKAFTNTDLTGSNNMDVSWRGSAGYKHRSGSGRGESDRSNSAGPSQKSSMQALTIDKARDLVDDSDDESGDGLEGAEDGDDPSKKPLNVHLYILGEYDILNDLANDGAKRLRDNKENSDREVLIQNEPCPPPDRWVRSTGWGKCNPSSNYAKIPPSDFDWVRYYDKLRLKDPKNTSNGEEAGGNEAGAENSQDQLSSSYHLPKDSTTTQATESTAAHSTESSVTSTPLRNHNVPPPPPELTPIPGSPAYIGGKTAPTDPSTPLGGGGSGGGAAMSNAPPTSSAETTDFLSASARAPRTRRRQNSNTKKTSFNDPLSASERVPHTRNSRSSSGSAAASGYVPRGHGSIGVAVSQPAQTEQPDMLSASERVPRTRNSRSSSGRAAASGYVPRGHGSIGVAVSQPAQTEQPDMLSASERVPRTRRGIIRRSNAGPTAPSADPLSMSERIPRSKRGFGTRMSKLMSRKSSVRE